MANELKPCPFCNASGADLEIKTDAAGIAWVYCWSCGTEGPYVDGASARQNIGGAVQKWNRRANEPQPAPTARPDALN